MNAFRAMKFSFEVFFSFPHLEIIIWHNWFTSNSNEFSCTLYNCPYWGGLTRTFAWSSLRLFEATAKIIWRVSCSKQQASFYASKMFFQLPVEIKVERLFSNIKDVRNFSASFMVSLEKLECSIYQEVRLKNIFFAIPSLLLHSLETVLKSYLQDTTLVLQRWLPQLKLVLFGLSGICLLWPMFWFYPLFLLLRDREFCFVTRFMRFLDVIKIKICITKFVLQDLCDFYHRQTWVVHLLAAKHLRWKHHTFFIMLA